jgi:hypothetical protein
MGEKRFSEKFPKNVLHNFLWELATKVSCPILKSAQNYGFLDTRATHLKKYFGT